MRHIICAALLAATASAGAAGQTVDSLFAAMPDSIVPVMSRDNRLDCLDFYKSGMTANVRNILGGKCSIDTMGADYLRLSPTAASDVELRLYGADGGAEVVAVAYTYGAPARETVVRFYSADGWKPIATASLIEVPAKAELVRPGGGDALDDAFVCASMADGSVTFSLSTDGLSPDDLKKAKPYVGAPISYAWNGRRFERK